MCWKIRCGSGASRTSPQILSEGRFALIVQNGDSLNFGLRKAAMWLRLTVCNATSDELERRMLDQLEREEQVAALSTLCATTLENVHGALEQQRQALAS